MRKILLLLLVLTTQQIIAQKPNENNKLFHQFDFWLGHWNVYKFGTDTLVGESYIESIIDSVGILENYSAERSKYTGKSLNKYNPEKKRWEQYWIDNSGLTLFLSGGIVGRKMVMEDMEHGDPQKGLNKISWEMLNRETVRQTWSISKDGGKTWSVVFDGEYKKRKT